MSWDSDIDTLYDRLASLIKCIKFCSIWASKIMFISKEGDEIRKGYPRLLNLESFLMRTKEFTFSVS
jgi:hypothetical protein